MSGCIPREAVERLIAMLAEKDALERQKAGTMAKLIRGAITKIRQDVNASPAMRRAEGWNAQKLAREEHARDQALAFIHLEWLATQLENQSGELAEGVDLGHQPLHIRT